MYCKKICAQCDRDVEAKDNEIKRLQDALVLMLSRYRSGEEIRTSSAGYIGRATYLNKSELDNITALAGKETK